MKENKFANFFVGSNNSILITFMLLGSLIIGSIFWVIGPIVKFNNELPRESAAAIPLTADVVIPAIIIILVVSVMVWLYKKQEEAK